MRALALVVACSVATLTGAGRASSAVPRGAAPRAVPLAAPAPPPDDGESYSLLGSQGDLVPFGAAFGATGPVHPGSPIVGAAGTADGQGAWIVDADGGVAVRGDAVEYGQLDGTPLTQPIVGIAADMPTGGYWLVASDGGVFAFHAPFEGSAGAIHLNRPIVGMATTPGGKGYWLVASDGGIFSYGDAKFHGSTGNLHLVQPIVGMAATSDGRGYWLVAADGGIFTFGDARYHGSTGGKPPAQAVIGMAAEPDGAGYWLATAAGAVYAFGDATSFGSAQPGGSFVGIVLESGGYQNPLRSLTKVTPERVDQGVDYAGAGPIYAIGDGTVLNTTNAGWPGGAFITYQLSDGRAKGDIVYVAENVKPEVTIGQEVTPHTVLGILIDSYPNLETGWADPPGDGESLARAEGQWSTYDDQHDVPTAYGENFSQLLASLGAEPGISHAAPDGTVPPGWPTWPTG
jgi:hypothetical protein